MVIPKKNPQQIMDDVFAYGDKDVMVKLLIGFQKLFPIGWDEYRKKIPDDILEKWGTIMSKCHENGFVSPRVYGNKIHWKQVMGMHTDLSDECTMCRNTFVSGECKGQLKINNKNERVFIPCWKMI